MKKNLTLLLAFVFMALTQVNAQQTGDEIFVIDLKIDGVVTNTFKKAACGFSAPADWSGAITGDFCLPVVWGYDITPDSLGCDSIANDYTGKAVMIRRGACEFGAKCLNVEKAGGAFAIIANGYAATHGDGCNAPGMGAGAVGAQVTIPAVLLCRNAVDIIDAALKAGKTTEICVRRLSLHDPSAEYAYATPISQADTVELITFQAVNRTGIAQDFVGKVEITDPAGTVTTLESTQFIEPGGDSVIYFPSYIPVPQLGTYKIQYSADKANNVGDTLYREFRFTDHTFATDNLKTNGGAANDASFVVSGIYSAASLYKTGDAGMVAQYATFGINNAAAVAVADPTANVLNVVLYDADPNDDGVNDIGTDLAAFDLLPFVGFNDFEFSASAPVDSLYTVELTPIDGDKVTLKPNHLYYLRVIYDGNAAATGKQLSLTVTNQVEYLSFTNTGLITPITLDALYSGWGGATVVTRLQEEGYDVTTGVKSELLSKLKFNVSPNPTSDFVNLSLDLAGQNKSVVVSLVDYNGSTVSSQTLKNFQSGQVKFNVRNLPSGYYAVSVRTSEEGNAVSSLMICH